VKGASLRSDSKTARRFKPLQKHFRQMPGDGKGRLPRKWWYVEDTRDPMEIPHWQIDHGYAWRHMMLSLFESRKQGKIAWWQARVLEQNDDGSEVQLLHSGLKGWMPRSQEGPTRPEIGTDLTVQCIKYPMKRIRLGEKKFSRYPSEREWGKNIVPVFSHLKWRFHQANIKKAQTLEGDTIVEGWVSRHVYRGLIVQLAPGEEGGEAPVGLIEWRDISRRQTSGRAMQNLFPPGTPIKAYCIHTDKKNGRITLSTKEFEDDDHVGWMGWHPEWCFRHAEEGLARYHRKRDNFIAALQE